LTDTLESTKAGVVSWLADILSKKNGWR
jgi:hypothetical protein